MLTTQIGMDVRNIKLVPYDPKWADVFEQDKERLERILHKYKDKQIHHVGSTSIPTIPKAKPVIDIMVAMNKESGLLAACKEVYFKGFRSEDDCSSINGSAWWLNMRAYSDRKSEFLMNVFHFVPFCSSKYNDFLFFKRYMIEHPEEAQRYFELKQSLIRENINLYDYAEGKGRYIDTINAKANKLYAGQQL